MSNDITALIAKLREYIPNGDGHDSEFAHTLQSAIEALSSRPEGEAVAIPKGWAIARDGDWVSVAAPDGNGVRARHPTGTEQSVNDSVTLLVRLADALLSASPAAAEVVPDADEETYQMGKRDGYEEAVQEIDLKTGGDGEYRYCMDGDPDRHTPDAPAMISRIVERFNEKEAASAATIGSLAKALKALSFAAQITGGTAGRDDSLRAAIDQAEDAMSLGGIGEAVNRALDMEAELARLRTQSAASEHSLAMVGAQVVAVPATSLKEAFDRWQDERIGRAALVKAQQKESIDPLELFGAGYRYAFLSTPPVDANKGGVPEGWAVREGISAGTYTLVHPSGIKFTFGHDGSMYAGAVADFLKAMLSAAPSAPVAADESLKEVIGAGTRLSNIAYNFAQNPGHALTSEDVSIFDRERKRWDRAVSALAPRKADGKEAQG